MVLGFLRKLFKTRKTYTINDDDYRNADSVIFERPDNTAPRLLKAEPLSPILWRYIFPRSPAHPVDLEQKEEEVVSSGRYSCTRASITSSAGYGSQTSDDSYPRLGATSMGGDSAEIRIYSEQSSPVAEVCEQEFINDRTLPPVTPYRVSFARQEYRKKSPRKAPSAPILNEAEKESSIVRHTRFASIFDVLDTPTTNRALCTPVTLPPVTLYRASFVRREMRKKSPTRKAPSAPLPDPLDKGPEEIYRAPAKESSAVVTESIWGEPEYSPASTNDLDDSPCSSVCTPYREEFTRHEGRKISLRRMPSAAVSGRVKKMVRFFENDSKRVEIPRRLDHVSPDYMRSCPQINFTPTPRSTTSHEHRTTHSDLIRGVANASDRCIRCASHYRTPNSRRSMA